MPLRPIAHRSSLCTRIAVLATAAWFVGVSCAEEEVLEPQLLREANAEVARLGAVGLSPFQPVGVSSRVRRTLLQFDALVADDAWGEAIELIERLQNEAGTDLTKLPALPEASSPLGSTEGHTIYAPLAARCQQMLTSLSSEGLAAYRDRVDRTARDRFDDAARRLDEPDLQEVIEEFLASESAGEALLALGELALERGDVAAARRALHRLHPLLWGPFGRPAAVTLSLLNPDADPAELAKAWQAAGRPAQIPVTPANEALLPLALSRLALTSLREGDRRRAEAETLLLEGITPDATGRLAGREQPLADALRSMIQTVRSTESQQRDAPLPDYAWAWSNPTEVRPEPSIPTRQVNNRVGFQINGRNQQQILQLLRNPQPTAKVPATIVRVATHDLSAFYVERNELKSLDLATGETEPFNLPGLKVEATDTTPRPAIGDMAANRFMFGNGGVIRVVPGRGAVAARPSGPVTRIDPSLTLADGILYARVVTVTPSQRNVRNAPSAIEETLIGQPVDTEEPTTVRFVPPSGEPGAAPEPGTVSYQFAGPPTVRGPRLYIAVARPGVRTRVAIACYGTATGRKLWMTDIGSGEPVSRTGGGSDLPVTLAGDTVYAATNLGAITALDATTGNVRWIACYPRDGAPTFNRPGNGPTSVPRPCVVTGDQVIAAPADSTRLLAWDTATGRPLWDTPRGDTETEIVGVSRDTEGAIVLLSGRQIAGYDALTGACRFRWPESQHAGLKGVGHAALMGRELLWPTKDALYLIDPAKGGLTRPPVDLSSIGSDGASIVRTDYGPLICGAERLRLLAELPPGEETAKSEPQARVSRLIETGR